MSTKGKKASEAAHNSDRLILENFSKLSILFILSIDILQLSILLDCPEPIPTVEKFLERTIAFDLTYLHILNAKIKFFKVSLLGLILDTTLKLFDDESKSIFCNQKIIKI